MSSSMSGSKGPYEGMKLKSGEKLQQIPNYTPQQMQLHDQQYAHVGPDSYTARLAAGDEGLFNEMEAPAMRQFQELQGENASRFSGMGMGARKGSGFQNYQNTATSNFAQDLQSKRQELMRNALKDLMGMSDSLLKQEPWDTEAIVPKPKKSFLEQMFAGAAPIAGAVGGGILSGGNPAGVMAGYQAGNAASQAFS